jgi:hypothetical protein
MQHLERTLSYSLIPRTPPTATQYGLRIVECDEDNSPNLDLLPVTLNGVERQQSVYGLVVGGGH